MVDVPTHFDSAPDADTGQVTRLTFNRDLGVFTQLAAYQGDQQVFSLMPQPYGLFTIGFFKYDLSDLTRNVPAGDPNYLGSVAYPQPSDEKPTVERSDSDALVLRFDNVKPVTSSNISATDFKNIQAWMSFTKPTDAAAAGWIDLDLEFTFPDAVKADDAGIYGWQTRVVYPDLRFLNSLIYSSADKSGYLLLDPHGKVETFYDAALKVGDVTLPKAPMPVPFAAIYELSSANNLNAAKGVALAAVDNYGSHKELFHGSTHAGQVSMFAFRYIAPIHLKADRYVRPAKYKLSGGMNAAADDTDRLFSGAGLHYRLRCFDVGGKLPGVPADWYDVADLYRKWVRRSTVSRNFRKDIPHPPSPVTANMNPHTVAINYSLDGQIDPNPNPSPPVKNNPQIRTWLEVHPVAAPPDMPGNTNEPLPALLSRIQGAFANWSADEDLGGALASAPAASFRSPNRLDLFAIGNNSQLTYAGWDGVAWSPWKDLSSGLSLLDRPASVSWGAGRVDVFARGTDDKVHHFHFKSNAWQPKKTLSFAAKALAAASSAPNLLDLFTLDAGGKVLHASYGGTTWTAQTNLGGPANVKLLSLAACFRQPNLLYVFALDDKGALWFKVRTAAQWAAGWTPLGGVAKEMPTAVSWGPNRLDVFARGTDGKLRHIYLENNTWGKWKSWHLIASSPSVVSPSRNRLEIFSRRAADGALLRSVFDTRLEAQVWGFEIGGFYRYLCGLPPATNVINNDPARFKKAMQVMIDQGVVPSATTDPLMPCFNRLRFRGHLLKVAQTAPNPPVWVEAIGNPFPARIEQYLKPASGTRRGTTVLLGSNKQVVNDRVLLINRAHPDYAAFADSVSARRTHNGGVLKGFGPLADSFYGTDTQSACPVEKLENAYLALWLKKGLLDENFRVIEFMKYHYSADYCYDRSHAHVVPQPAEADPTYTKAVGYGHWHTQRLASLLKRLQVSGANNDRGRDAVFSLTFEFVPLENLVPYLEEFYERNSSTARMFVYVLPPSAALPDDLVADSTSLPLRSGAARLVERPAPVFHFVYSERITQKMDLADMDNLIHPGYRETPTGLKAANPMLAPARDDDQNNTAFTFAQWKSYCEQYCVNFKVDAAQDGYGIAPRDYVTATGSYTYNRALAATFNLRSWIFRYGAAAVMGERIILPAAWFEPPNGYYAEAIRMGVLGARMQMRFKEFFRSGYMLGQTQMLAGNKALWAWRARRRNFSDVAELVSKTYGTPPGGKVFLYDAISRGTDAEVLSPPDSGNYVGNEKEALYNAFRIKTDKIQHMVWCRDLPANRRELLYVFANVGNRNSSGGTNDPKVNFLYSRGLETGAGWKRTIYTFDAAAAGTAGAPQDIQYGGTEEISMNARSLSVVRIYQQ